MEINFQNQQETQEQRLTSLRQIAKDYVRVSVTGKHTHTHMHTHTHTHTHMHTHTHTHTGNKKAHRLL